MHQSHYSCHNISHLEQNIEGRCSFVVVVRCCKKKKSYEQTKQKCLQLHRKRCRSAGDKILSSQRVKEHDTRPRPYLQQGLKCCDPNAVCWWRWEAVKKASEVTNKLLPDLPLSLSSLLPGHTSVLSRDCLSPAAPEHGSGWLSQLRADLHLHACSIMIAHFYLFI